MIIGGYGTFGSRLVELLKRDSRVEIIVAGRDATKADQVARKATFDFPPPPPPPSTSPYPYAKISSTTFDRSWSGLAKHLKVYSPNLVVDASGPFQSYGDDKYALPRACAEVGIDYLDLADDSAFVNGIDVLNDRALEAGKFVISGLSTFPALSGAVLSEMEKKIGEVATVEGGVAPSPYVSMGESVIGAILSYAGKKIRISNEKKKEVKEGGQEVQVKEEEGKAVMEVKEEEKEIGVGMVSTRRFHIAVPGSPPFPSLSYALVDVPDNRLLFKRYPNLESVWIGAGTRPQALLSSLQKASRLVSSGVLPSLKPFTTIIRLAQNTLKWGEHRGGFYLSATDRTGERAVSYHLDAPGDSGPMVPAIAAAAFIDSYLTQIDNGGYSKNSKKSMIRPGARPADREVPLAAFEKYFDQFDIKTGFRVIDTSSSARHLSLYERILGDSFYKLLPEIQEVHAQTETTTFIGRSQIRRGKNPISTLIANLFGFPHEGDNVLVEVEVRKVGKGTEIWTRKFGEKSFVSFFTEGYGKEEGLLVERFGPFSFAQALVATSEGNLDMKLKRWRVYNLPLPLFLAPRSIGFESVEGGRFKFYVGIKLPLIGNIVEYWGSLRKETVITKAVEKSSNVFRFIVAMVGFSAVVLAVVYYRFF